MEQVAVCTSDVDSDRSSLSNISLQPYYQTSIFWELPSYKTVRRTKCLSSKNEQIPSMRSSRNEISNLQHTYMELQLFEDSKRPLRELPINLAEKKKVREKRECDTGSLSSWEIWKQSQQTSLKRLKEEVAHAVSWFELWKSPLNEIEGRYGTGIQSYFTFLRFLVFLNLSAFLLVGGFVLLPSIYINMMKLNQSDTEHLRNITFTAPECYKYDPHPGGLVLVYKYILDLVSGTGFMEASYMFYGYYKFGIYQKFIYNFPLAYLLTMILYFLLCLCWIVKRIVSGFKQEFMHEKNYSTRHSAKIFALWNFCIKETMMATLKQRSIVNELKIDLEEQMCRKRKAERSTKEKVFLYCIRFVLNLFIMILLTGAFYCIYQATTSSQHFQQKGSESKELPFVTEFFMEYLPSIVISISNILLPFLFRIIVRYEEYPPNTEINLLLIRSVFLRLANLSMLMFSLWQHITCSDGKGKQDCKACGYNRNYRHTLYNYCRPGKRLFRASSSKIFFQLILLFGLVVAIIPVIVNVATVYPSKSCGPFRHYESAWGIIPEVVSTLPSGTQSFLNYIISEGFFLLLITALCMVLTTLVALVQANRSTITQLKRHLILAGKDKRYLVKKLSTHSQHTRDDHFQDRSSESAEDDDSISTSGLEPFNNRTLSRRKSVSYLFQEE
ncbi:transmembrane channel-like protein 7 isoform X2 [Heterodontus francisci]|uniref:transmembrane channel-like protein 7 isoform X2 n=1 Tax=Heterodontus francisci TaxID=7792 RepID=UPI00355AF4EE